MNQPDMFTINELIEGKTIIYIEKRRMDFDLEWTLDDARYVTREAYEAVAKDPTNKKLVKTLTTQGKMYTMSLSVLNEYCKPELAEYRKALVAHASKAEQERLLDNLYKVYNLNMSKEPYRKVFQEISSFFRSIFGRTSD